MTSYKDKVNHQIKQYQSVGKQRREGADIEELPGVFHYWSNRYILPLIQDIFGVNSIYELYTQNFTTSILSSRCFRLLSLGCGDCSFEVEIAKGLLGKGVNDFVFDCFELSPHLISLSRERIDAAGLANHFQFTECDINTWDGHGCYAGVMAHQALHHIVSLERLFEQIRKVMTPESVFVVSDMIGRNGHMRWPETLDIVQGIWAFLPDHLKYNQQLDRFDEIFVNHDCSVQGFEGIRSQDILPLLVENFHFDRFLAYGGLPEVFIERAFGHNYNPNDPKERAFVDFLEMINRLLIDLGYLKPTMMFAVLDLKNGGTRCYRHWTPEFCVRKEEEKQIHEQSVPVSENSLLKRIIRKFK